MDGAKASTVYTKARLADDLTHDLRLIFRSDKYIQVYLDGVLRHEAIVSNLTFTSGYVYLYSFTPEPDAFVDTRFDDLRLRRYVYPEPRIEILTEEEFDVTPSPTPSSIITPTLTPSQIPTPTIIPSPTQTSSPFQTHSPSPASTPTPSPETTPEWMNMLPVAIAILAGCIVIAFAIYLGLRRR